MMNSKVDKVPNINFDFSQQAVVDLRSVGSELVPASVVYHIDYGLIDMLIDILNASNGDALVVDGR